MNMSRLMNSISRTITKNVFSKDITICYASSKTEIIEKQNTLFTLEKKRQKEAVGRVEKITVNYVGLPEKVDLVMNRNISTPYDCARHLNEIIVKRSAVALLNNDTLWHMHRPIPESCTLDLLHFTIQQPAAVNKIFWRTCSFLLGATASIAFKDKINVHLHSFPIPNVRSGSFVYDVELDMENWTPTQEELRVLSIEMLKLVQQDNPLEYLSVSRELALEIFENNPHKKQQIPDIAAHNDGKIPIFRAGQHLDISRGPMISHTGQIGRATVTAVHKLASGLYRFQGVALPNALRLNHFAYALLEERAAKLNSARLPGKDSLPEDEPVASRVVQ